MSYMYPPRFVPEIQRKKKKKIPKVCPKLKTTQKPAKTDCKYLPKADKETKRIPNKVCSLIIFTNLVITSVLIIYEQTLYSIFSTTISLAQVIFLIRHQ